MKLFDKIYGEEEVNENVLIELINSKDMQRLNGITQQGMPREYWFAPVFTRYEHSLGVLILLRRLGASIEEQIAGLIHDVSHTAFSHVVDWVFGDPSKEDYQDNAHLEVIQNGEVGKILKKYNFNVEEIADLDRHTLLEKELPFVCADRLDYALREILHFESRESIDFILNSVKNEEGKIVFTNSKAAFVFAENFAKCQRELWAAPDPRLRYHILSSALKEAIDEGIISKEDFMSTDWEIIKILEKKGSSRILDKLNILKKKINYVESKEGIKLVKKFRYVNPLVLVNGELKELNKVSVDYERSLRVQEKEARNIVRVVLV